MKRTQVLACSLIIAFLLLTASQSQFSIAMRIGPAMETVNDDMKMMIRTAKPKPNSANRFLLAWEPGTQLNGDMRKVPSAPNPIGNRHPPSKP